MNSENLSEDIQESGRLLLADGPWDPLGDEPRPLEYTMRKKGERTYAKNAAVDTTFQVKVNDRYRGQRLRDIRRGLHGMFEDILQEARGDLAGNDLGRVVIHHDGLHDPIVVPLRPWDRLNVDVVMEHIEKVLWINRALRRATPLKTGSRSELRKKKHPEIIERPLIPVYRRTTPRSRT